MADSYLQTEGSSYTRERSGVRRFDLVFVIPGPAAEGATEPFEVLDSWGPEAGPLDLPEVDRDAKKQPDGDWLLTITYEGSPGGGALDPQVEIEDSDVDSPIESFEDFEAVNAKYGPYLRDDDGNFKGWPAKIKDGSGKLVKNPMWGQTHFLDGNTIIVTTFGLQRFDADLFRNMRKIDPAPLVPEGTAGDISRIIQAGKSFLKKKVTAQYRGNVWLFKIHYWVGNWNPDVYTAKE